MNTPFKVREYYDNQYYGSDHIGNPAHEIYDHLRITYIRNFAQTNYQNALIVGCGSNRDLSILSYRTGLYAFDLSLQGLRRISKRQVPVFAADALKIPFEKESFDLVICSEVLEHIEDIRSAVKELRRVLKPNGTLIVSSPNWISWFGLVRWFVKKVFKKDIHSDDQPYDDWKTLKRYISELSPEFEVCSSRGVWYLPPLHFRRRGLPKSLMKWIYFIYSPIEKLLSKLIPGAGHLIVLKCQAK